MKARIERASIFVFAALLLVVASLAHSQVTATPYAVNQNGVPIPSALVTVCATNPGVGSCGSPATLFTDATLTTQCSGSLQLLNNQSSPSVGSGCSNPGYSDNLGNVVAFTQAGTYFCQYSGASFTTYTQPCPVPGLPPMIFTTQFGAVGNGAGNQAPAINSALASCPQTSPTIGCDVWIPQGTYNTTQTIAVGLLKSVHLHGLGSSGTNGCGVTIQTNGAIYGITIGNGTSPNTSGFQIDNICFKDATSTGLGGIDVLATRDFRIDSVSCIGYQVGACFVADGGTNFTQFGTVTHLMSWLTKYGILTNNKTASIYVFGAEFNCQNSGSTDIITGSRAIDLGYTNHTAATGTATEWSVDMQAQNCEIGIALYNAGGNHFWGKAVENTINARPSNSFGVLIDGDTSSLANGNVLDAVQITKAGTAIYLKPNATNTAIITPVFNGTNGVDLVVDAGALGSTRIVSNKRFTGWQTNFSAVSRNTNTVTGTTTASSDNGDLSIVPGTLIEVFNVTGGTTSFNGVFPVLTVSTNDSTNITTLTWSQTGANESGTINGAACGGAGSCVGPLSTILNAGVGVAEITGEQINQDLVLQTPSIPNQENLPTTCLAGTSKIFTDGTRTDICENNGGLLHLVDGYTNVYTGTNTGFYTPQPNVVTGGNGTVNTAGTTVTWASGNFFALSWTGSITINNVVYTISAVNSLTQITLTSTAGTQTGVNYNASGIPGIPPCSSPSGNVCQSSDDKKRIVATNTNGSTICLPPLTNAQAYPPAYGFAVDFEPGGSVANVLSVTPPGATSFYSIACAGTAVNFRGVPTAKNLSGNQGFYIYTNGSNWFAVSGAEDVPLDQLLNGILNTNNINLTAGSFNGGGSGANNGANYYDGAGSTNSTGGKGGERGISGGPAPASGTNGPTRVLQYFNAGVGLGSKNGFIVRACRDVTGTDCVNTVPAGNNGAVRLTLSGTDSSGAVGIVFAGSGVNSPSQIQVGGVYTDANGGAIVEGSSTCTAGQFYLIDSTGADDSGAGMCSNSDSGARIGIALTAVSGCAKATPCHVPVLVLPGAGTWQFATATGCTASGSVCTGTGTWPSAFLNTSYTIYCTPTGEASNSSAIFWISAQTTTGFTVSIDNRGMSNPGGYSGFSCMGHL